ncbi:MAG TPA: thiamine diphosphokinase [bacterium]|nr:thiamine diphosphokinase [bacterium]HPR89583.1 thiamine diphosphokinase [bacterium]
MPKPADALIIANGPLPPRRRILPWIRTGTLIVCADGGANRARVRGITPDVILGDLDSLSPEGATASPKARLLRITDQAKTDLEKALDFVLQQGIRRAVVIGATGRRPDHELANFSLLARYHTRLELMFLDTWCRILIVDAQLSLSLRPGTIVSLLPLGPCAGVVTRGLAWPLRGEPLAPGVRESISNRVVASPVEIELTAGKLLVFIVDRV